MAGRFPFSQNNSLNIFFVKLVDVSISTSTLLDISECWAWDLEYNELPCYEMIDCTVFIEDYVPIPMVYVHPTTNTAPVGQLFTINVSIANLLEYEALFAWEIKLAYNSSVLECISVVEGEFLQRSNESTLWIPSSIYNETGIVNCACTISSASTGVPRNGELASFTFRVLHNGTSHLNLTKIVLLDENIEEITFTSENGRFYDPPLLGDINGDFKVDIRDIAIAAIAFGSFPGHDRWNPLADINADYRIDIRDIAQIAIHFGEEYS